MLSLSKYTILFQRDKDYYVYSSRTNSFYTLSEDAFQFINSEGAKFYSEGEEKEFIELLRKKKIVVPEGDDEAYFEEKKMLYNMGVHSPIHLSLTIAPTVQCNLRCPYCFEETKPKGVMTDEIIDATVEFIGQHEVAKSYSITWFGGEPLLGIEQIAKLLDKLTENDKIEMRGHSLITNGTLLNDRAIEVFTKYPLDEIQITLDGWETTHDEKRFFENGSGSFSLIMSNAEHFVKACPDTNLTFRINVDNKNSGEYIKIYRYICKKFSGAKVGVYPGILRANRGCESETFFTTKDHLAFFKTLREHGISDSAYPTLCSKGCCATKTAAYVIGPFGEIYRCWEHVGDKTKIVGNVAEKEFSNPGLMAQYINNGHCFDDPKCRECALMPICSGGCAKRRIENLLDGAEHELCTIYNDDNQEALHELLYQYYLTTRKN